MKWLLLLLIPLGLLMFSSGGSAQTVPTPNASVSALLTKQAGLESQLPSLQATEQAARATAAAAQGGVGAAVGAVRQVQSGINQTKDEVQVGLGQQALEAAGRSQDAVQALEATVAGAGQAVNHAVGELDRAAAAYRTAVSAVKATSEGVVQAAATTVTASEVQAATTVKQKEADWQRERDTERIITALLLGLAGGVGYRIRARRAGSQPQPAAAAPPPVEQTELEFIESNELGAHFDKVHHDPMD